MPAQTGPELCYWGLSALIIWALCWIWADLIGCWYLSKVTYSHDITQSDIGAEHLDGVSRAVN